MRLRSVTVPPIAECMVDYSLFFCLSSAWDSNNMEDRNLLGYSCESSIQLVMEQQCPARLTSRETVYGRELAWSETTYSSMTPLSSRGEMNNIHSKTDTKGMLDTSIPISRVGRVEFIAIELRAMLEMDWQ